MGEGVRWSPDKRVMEGGFQSCGMLRQKGNELALWEEFELGVNDQVKKIDLRNMGKKIQSYIYWIRNNDLKRELSLIHDEIQRYKWGVTKKIRITCVTLCVKVIEEEKIEVQHREKVIIMAGLHGWSDGVIK